ncbi:hypothetical protein Tco_1060105, partial [Tanacetum coccineum]
QLYNHVIMIDYSSLLFPNIPHIFCDQASAMDIGSGILSSECEDERKKMVLTVRWKQMQMGKARGLSKQEKGHLHSTIAEGSPLIDNLLLLRIREVK